MVAQELLERANARAQRRFHRMIVERAYSDPTNRITRLYVQAERLIDALRGEAAWDTSMAEWTRLQADDPEAPDYFETEYERQYETWGAFVGPTEHWTAGELAEAWGK